LCKACYAIAKQAVQQGGVPLAMENRIQELRKKNKLSQEELAYAVGVTRQTITSLEVGKYTASLPLAYKIARYFDLTIEQVFDFTEVEWHGKV
jgi:putative transcriptional regulator